MQVEIIDERKQQFNGERFYRNKHGYFIHDGHPLQRVVWEYHNGEIPKGYDIHHVDFDKSNNDISNLQMLTRREHRQLHTDNAKHEIVCETCGETFIGTNAKLCPKCRIKHRPEPKRLDELTKRLNKAARRVQSIISGIRACPICNRMFFNYPCHRKGVVTKCELCGKTFE